MTCPSSSSGSIWWPNNYAQGKQAAGILFLQVFPRRIICLSRFPLSSFMSGEGLELNNICKGSGSKARAQPTLPTTAGQATGRCPLGDDGSFSCLLLLTKEECSGRQDVFKGEVAKIITRVWEENQGVAGPQRHLGGSDSRWRHHASTSRAAGFPGAGVLGALWALFSCAGQMVI